MEYAKNHQTRIDFRNRGTLTQKEAAEYLGVSVDTLRRRTVDGTIKCYAFGPSGRQRLYKVEDLLDALVPVPTVGTLACGAV